ncbi:MAG: ligase-associated DNA damage response endonuclease PdeM [Sphingobacteriia bacterium]|nr:MAG: ligase-associated DNA damage response endonuclease PdeM [Sphingobacteriia bacterium]TAG29396.1 MAG: ligase-associated DNA damage response endonuclease PdeM [Sphingobacteriia bacterium]
MTAPILHIVEQNRFWLSPHRAIFWEDEKALIVSDTHFGKTGHFRKHGIAVPPQVYQEDLQRFFNLIHEFKVEKIIIVGDFFHSVANEELNLFLKWRSDFLPIHFILVRGNHDILHNNWYTGADIKVYDGVFTLNGFQFVHDPAILTTTNKSLFTFSGHIHPGIAIKGMAKQSLKFPCFYFTQHQCILPAFSKFSGLKIMKQKKGSRVFILNEGAVIPL